MKQRAQNVRCRLQHLGCTVPPQADATWIGEAGPRPSHLDPGSGGRTNDNGAIPAHGDQRSAWDAGARFDFANPEYC